ncbi:hypothetical protein [Edwardsiella anguillarum]|uniref:hypothetical protein n=1 Tax=Edwardsiella anguillarum TaxID=1821960 RepID=UPI0024B64C0A|nr:hypothetical protein [Edwardsiella anguillarum]WHQ12983.1 hypothetical protein MQ083_11825 [Edwardsiella anguillarum]
MLGAVRNAQQEVIQSEGGLERDLRITFDEHGQISAAWQGYGPNPLWQSQLDRDGWGGWISRSVVALQMGQTQSLSQQVCVYKRDGAGRITKATQVEAGNGTLGITRQYYVYTPDGRVRFYLSLGQSPGYGLYFYRPDGRLRLVIRHNGLSSSRFTADGRDLGGLAQTPFITYLMTCQRRELPPDSQTGAGARRGPGQGENAEHPLSAAPDSPLPRALSLPRRGAKAYALAELTHGRRC